MCRDTINVEQLAGRAVQRFCFCVSGSEHHGCAQTTHRDPVRTAFESRSCRSGASARAVAPWASEHRSFRFVCRPQTPDVGKGASADSYRIMRKLPSLSCSISIFLVVPGPEPRPSRDFRVGAQISISNSHPFWYPAIAAVRLANGGSWLRIQPVDGSSRPRS